MNASFLTEDDIAQYHREGYLLKEGLIPSDLLALAQAAITSDHPTAEPVSYTHLTLPTKA